MRIKDKVISCVMSFWFDDRFDECFFFLFVEIDVGLVWIDGLILHLILSCFWSFFLKGKIFFKSSEFIFVFFVLGESHILGQEHILGDLGSDFVEVAVVKQPMLRKHYFVRKMGWIYVGWLFVEGSSDVGVDCCIGGKVDSIINFFYLHAIVLSVIFSGQFLIGDCSFVCAFLY